ncbi:MAG: RNA polymerase factor sigma-54 [Planctomycetes bacterium]|nr:RNA polymerase factor sigma-54 [Planctomycetota bacterium]
MLPGPIKISHGLQHKMHQTMKLSAQQIMAMKMLQLPMLELINIIKQELEENPTLDVEAGSGAEGSSLEETGSDEKQVKETSDNPIDVLDDSRGEAGEISGESARKGFNKWLSLTDKKIEAMLNTPAKPITLPDYLHQQFTVLNVSARIRLIGENIIYNIDAEGYLRAPLEEILRLSNEPGTFPDPAVAGLELGEVEQALKIIQMFDPRGVGARSLPECLLLQLDEDDPCLDLKKKLITKHLKEIEENKLPALARAFDLPMEEIIDCVEQIKRLNPHPGADFSNEAVPYVVPEIIITQVDGRYEVVVENRFTPRLMVNPYYLRLLQEKKNDPQTRDFVKKKMESAANLIDAIQMRQQIVRRIAEEIVNTQQEFLAQGVNQLRPLLMKDMAKRLGVHISTISRAVANKYVQTPQGLFKLRFFFSVPSEINGPAGRPAGGQPVSQTGILATVKEIFAQEDKKNPSSDMMVAKLLREKHNLMLSRRTVTKYRQTLNIPSADKRKVF